MKGIILSEFVEYLENELGGATAQKIIDDSGVASEGVYSRVGMYDYQELLQLLTQTASQTKTEASELLEGFSEHLFEMFKRDYGVFFEGVTTAGEMLAQIDNHIHVEVKKLYPDAELPKFECEQDGNMMTLHYTSPRPLATVAQALVGACLKFFAANESLIHTNIAADQKSATFKIQIAA
ncbi:MAG: heme NO-binding domain-containing protein [Acidiferrobacterales bacterium]|nr:heme NO-binding domain-containing protein [Acidiferrobacterales bacterium]